MYRVVVADDDGKACKKAVEFLQNNGYQVVGEAADGLEAVMVCLQGTSGFCDYGFEYACYDRA